MGGARKPKRRPRLEELRLIGPHTCRQGPCDGDGTHGVAFPGVRYDLNGGRGTIPTETVVFLCEHHATEATG